MAKILPPNSAKLFARKPIVDRHKCKNCKLCVKGCPAGAINQSLEINEDLCLRCFACVKKCPFQARKNEFKKGWLVKRFLKKQSRGRKEPEIFI